VISAERDEPFRYRKQVDTLQRFAAVCDYFQKLKEAFTEVHQVLLKNPALHQSAGSSANLYEEKILP